jgi:hypothetical protein
MKIGDPKISSLTLATTKHDIKAKIVNFGSSSSNKIIPSVKSIRPSDHLLIFWAPIKTEIMIGK